MMLDVAPARREAAVTTTGGVAVSGTSPGARSAHRGHVMVAMVVAWIVLLAIFIALPGSVVAGPAAYPRSAAAHIQGAACVTTSSGVTCGIGVSRR